MLKLVPGTLMTTIKNILFKEKTLGAHNVVITQFIDHIEYGSANPVSELEIMNTMTITDQICNIIEEGKIGGPQIRIVNIPTSQFIQVYLRRTLLLPSSQLNKQRWI